jgi:hypothetical protein
MKDKTDSIKNVKKNNLQINNVYHACLCCQSNTGWKWKEQITRNVTIRISKNKTYISPRNLFTKLFSHGLYTSIIIGKWSKTNFLNKLINKRETKIRTFLW